MRNPSGPKVILIIDYPFATRDAGRLGLSVIQDAGIQVAVWDLSYFFRPKASELFIEAPSGVDLTVCSSTAQLSSLCSTLTSQHVVIFVGCLNPVQAWRYLKALSMISATPARLTSVAPGHVPIPILNSVTQDPRSSYLSRAFSLLTNPHRWERIPKRLASSIFLTTITIQRKFHLSCPIRPLEHIWAGSTVSGIGRWYVDASTKVTYIHSLDYDLVIASRASGKQSPSRVVFIDSMGPLHPEYFLEETPPCLISPQTYSEIVCKGLDQIEKRLETEVIIAAHPRATVGVMEPWYQGRRVLYGQTPELIAGATAVILAHGSTSIGMAVVHQRPIVLLGSSQFDPIVQYYAEGFAQALDMQIIDLDAPELPPFTLDVNEETYAQFVHKYVKRQGTPEEPFWSVVASEIISDTKPPDGKKAD